MKLRVPDRCGAISHRGQGLEIAADGSVEVDDNDWLMFAAHGFGPWTEPSALLDSGAMKRDERVTQAININLQTSKMTRTEDIRARLLGAEDAVLPLEAEGPAAPTAGFNIDVEAISGLNRHELFAFLRAKSVSVSLPVTNEDLRAMARRALG